MDMEAVINSKLARDIAPANQGQFSLTIAGVASEAMRFLAVNSDGHAVSEDYHFKFHVELTDYISIADLIGKPACFKILDVVAPVYIHGVISQATYAGKRVDGESYHISLNSLLYPFKYNFQNRVFLNKNVQQIVEEVFTSGGLSAADYQFKLRGEYVAREFTIQYNESDYDFISRLLSHEGLFYVFEQAAQGVKLLVVDVLEDIPAFAHGEIRYQTQSGSVRAMQTIYTLNRRASLLTDNVRLKDYNYRTPEATLETMASCNSGVRGQGTAYRYGENFKTLDEGDRLARIRQQALDWQREVYLADSDVRGLLPGMKFSLTDHPNAALNGDYVVLAIAHKANQSAAQARGGNSREPTYKNQLTLIRAGIPYRCPVPAPRYINGVFTARVETTGGDYAYLDELGRYRIRMPFDLAGTSAGEASHAVRQAQCYSGSDYGMHFPLHAGTEVVVTCVNGDVDRPILLGALHNPELPNLVTSSNHSQNILRTWGDNELIMEDRKGEERTELFTREKKNNLSLDASQSGHKIYLASEEGEMSQYAAKTMLIESGDTQTVQSGKDHILTIENRQYLTTKNQQIEFKAASDIRQKAGNNVEIHSETENIEMHVGKDMIVDVQDNMSLEVRNKDLSIVVTNGNFEIRAAKAISVKGQGGGNITISQAGGSIVIDTGGAITISGQSVSIDGSSVYLKGAQVGQGGGGSGSGASGSRSATNIANLKLVALDLFNHVAQKAQDVAATIMAAKATAAERSEDLSVDALGMQDYSGSTTDTTGLFPTAANVLLQKEEEECIISDSPELRKKRLESYWGTADISVIKKKASDMLGLSNTDIPTFEEKKKNWELLVKRHFPTKDPDEEFKDKPDPFLVADSPAPGSSAYLNLYKYAMTDFGAIMIRKIIKESEAALNSGLIDASGRRTVLGKQNDYKPFQIRREDYTTAGGMNHFVTFPNDFPSITHYKYGGQKIVPVATIHHEFEHTRFGRYSKSDDSTDVMEEVTAVKELENPVRALSNEEPRYTYTVTDLTREQLPDKTINILDPSNIQKGAWTFCKNNPRKLTRAV